MKNRGGYSAFLTSVNVSDTIIKDNVGIEYYMDNPDFAPTRETPRADRVKELGRRALVLAGVVGAMATPMLAEAAPDSDAAQATETTALETAVRNPEQVILAELLSGARPNVVWNGAAILPAGTEVHSQPSNSEQSIIGVVRPKTVVLMQNFRIIKGGIRNGAEWAAVSQANKSSKPNQATDSRQVSWVNLTRTETRPGFGSLVYKNYNPNDPSGRIPQTIAASIDSRNNLQATGNGDIPAKQLSTMTILPARAVPNVLRTRGMVRARTKPRYILPAVEVAPTPGNTSPSTGPPKTEIVPPPTVVPVQPPPEVIQNPQPLEAMPGSQDRLTNQEKQLYRESQVQFLRNGQNWINGTLVSYQGKVGVVTCLHGITADLIAQNPDKQYKADGYFTTNQLPAPTDLIDEISPDVTYTVGSLGGQQVRVTSMAAMPGKDILFLGVDDQALAAQLGKPLPLESTNIGGERARAGAEVDAIGNSQVSGYKRIEGSEIFTVKVNLQSYNGENRDMWAVADNVEDYRTAPNGFGTSGRSVIVKNSNGSYSFLVGNSVRFFGPDRRGQLLPGDYAPAVSWVISQASEQLPKTTFDGVTGFELYDDVSNSELATLASIANN